MKSLFRVVLTGGPCGGKTSALALLKKGLYVSYRFNLCEATNLYSLFCVLHAEFTDFNILCTPEIPTIVMTAGAQYPGFDAGERLTHFEVNVLRLQLQMEDSICNIAKSTGGLTV